MKIKVGEYLLILYNVANGLYEKKELQEQDAYTQLEKLAKRFDTPFVLVKVLAVASPALSSPGDSLSSTQREGARHSLPEGTIQAE